MKTATLLITGLSIGSLLAQDPPSKAASLTPEEQAVADQSNAFEAAYNQGDAKAMSELFAEDIEWIDSDGEIIRGRQNIAEMLKKATLGGDGRVLTIDVLSVRSLAPEVLSEVGKSTVTEPDGSKTESSFTSVHVKKNGKWLVSQFTETGTPVESGAAAHLGELSWLLGDWKDEGGDLDVLTTSKWTEGGNQITRHYAVKKDNGSEDTGTEVICWDPSVKKIRSFVFESDGSLSENTWTQDGPRWLIQSRTVLPDGGVATAQHSLSRVDQDSFTWSSSGRELDGELLPNIEPVKIVRVK